MTVSNRLSQETEHRAESRETESAEPRLTAKTYRAPRIESICDVDALLEVLGPAQANYGGLGFGGN